MLVVDAASAVSMLLCGIDRLVEGGLSRRKRRFGGETGASRLVMVGSFPSSSWNSFFAGELNIPSSALRVRSMIERCSTRQLSLSNIPMRQLAVVLSADL